MKSKSLTITKGKTASERRMPPVHPGEILLEEFLKPLGLSQYRLAKGLSVPARRINEIVLGVRSITAETALRLALGARPRHLFRQFLAEGLLLAVLGGGAGMMLAVWGLAVVPRSSCHVPAT